MKYASYWHQTLGDAPTAEHIANGQDVPATCDVAIVGAGLTGLSAARALAKRGVRATVLEAQEVGWGASSRNGGMVLTGLKVGAHELVERFGMEIARKLDAASLAAIDFVERLIEEEHIDCDFSRSGHIALASKPGHYAQFERDAELINGSFDRSVKLVPQQSLASEVGSGAYFGGLVDEASAGVNPAKLVLGVARAAVNAGALVCVHNPVLAIDRKNGKFHIRAGSSMLSAEHVVIATGAYTGPESQWLRRRIVPIGSYVIATEALPDQLARAVAPAKRMMFDSKHFLHYYRLTSDQRVLFGGRASFVPESSSATEQSAEVLRADMIALFPQLSDVKIDYAWGGTIDFTADMLPHAGEIAGTYYAAGYAGHGVALATLLGSQIGAQVAGDTYVDSPFMRSTFPVPALGIHRMVPGLVSAAGAWYRLLDMVS